MPRQVFAKESEYEGKLETVGDLSEGFIYNLASLRRANNKLYTLCVAANQCDNAELSAFSNTMSIGETQ